MRRNETVTTIVGNIASTVGKRTLADGTVVASFRLASNERRWNRAEGAWSDGDRLFLTVTCWRELGENVVRSFVSGDPVVVFGRLRTHRYERDGAPSARIEMEAIAVGPDLNRCSAVITRVVRSAAPGSVRYSGPDSASGGPDSASGTARDPVAAQAEAAEAEVSAAASVPTPGLGPVEVPAQVAGVNSPVEAAVGA